MRFCVGAACAGGGLIGHFGVLAIHEAGDEIGDGDGGGALVAGVHPAHLFNDAGLRCVEVVGGGHGFVTLIMPDHDKRIIIR